MRASHFPNLLYVELRGGPHYLSEHPKLVQIIFSYNISLSSNNSKAMLKKTYIYMCVCVKPKSQCCLLNVVAVL